MKEMNWAASIRDCLAAVGMTAVGAMMCCMILAWAVSKEWLPMELCLKAVPILMGLCLFGSCCFSAGRAPRQKLPVACLTAVVMIALLLLVKALFFAEAKLVVDWRWSLPLLAALGAGFLISAPKTHRNRR